MREPRGDGMTSQTETRNSSVEAGRGAARPTACAPLDLMGWTPPAT
jgi:hypothetical protein